MTYSAARSSVSLKVLYSPALGKR